MTADRTMVLERVIKAPVSLVWGAWMNPETLPHWWGPDGYSCRTARIDLRAGGEWVFDMIGPDGTVYPNHHRYTVVDPQRRIDYTLHWGENGPKHADAWADFERSGRCDQGQSVDDLHHRRGLPERQGLWRGGTWPADAWQTRPVHRRRLRRSPTDQRRGGFAPRQRSEQYLTSSHTFSHFLRQVNGLPQVAQVLVGRSVFFTPRGITDPGSIARKAASSALCGR